MLLLARIFFFIRILGMVLWLILTCVIGIGFALVQWGNPSLGSTFARFYSWGVLRIAGITVVIEGFENLTQNQPCIYVANHQSAMDLATFGLIYPKRTVVIGKKEIRWIPFFGIFFLASGNILLDRQRRGKAFASLKKAVDAIRERHVSIWIFPEGTRNPKGEGLLPFKKGAFHMAIQSQVPIVPIVSGPLWPLIHWSDKVMRRGQVRIHVLPPIATTGLTDKDIDRLAAQTRAVMLEALPGLTPASAG